jgi:hypothetical protein
MRLWGARRGRHFMIVAFGVVLVVAAGLAPAAGAAGRTSAFAASHHAKHRHAKRHHAQRHAKRHHAQRHHARHARHAKAQLSTASAPVRTAAAPRSAKRPAAGAKARNHSRAKSGARRGAFRLAVAARLRARRGTRVRRRPARRTRVQRKKKAKQTSISAATTMPSPLRIAGLGVLALVPFVLIGGGLIWSDHRRRRVPREAHVSSQTPMRPKFRPKSWRRHADS